ncbi:hypothetical protein VaNZ11_013753, partial [Volvox africanus]
YHWHRGSQFRVKIRDKYLTRILTKPSWKEHIAAQCSTTSAWSIMFVPNAVSLSGSAVARRPMRTCRKKLRISSAHNARDSTSSAAPAKSISANAAASAVLAKVSAMLAASTTAALPSALQPPVHRFSEKEPMSKLELQGGLPGKVAVDDASSPAARSSSMSSTFSLPAEWVVVSSASEWFDQHRQASAAHVLLATVFVSDKAALAHVPLLEHLRVSFGRGADSPVRFIYVHVGDGYQRRYQEASTGSGAASARSSSCLMLNRVSSIAALYGLDVALTSFLPGGARAFPSLLLTAGPTGGSPEGTASTNPDNAAPWSWSTATRVGELRQLVSDWAFISDLRRRRERNKLRLQHTPRGIGDYQVGGVEVPPGVSPMGTLAAPQQAMPIAAPAAPAPAAGSRSRSDASAVLVNV